jgi:hypothetical protein
LVCGEAGYAARLGWRRGWVGGLEREGAGRLEAQVVLSIPPLKVPEPLAVAAGTLPVVGAGPPPAPVQAAHPRTRTAAAIPAAEVRGPRPLISSSSRRCTAAAKTEALAEASSLEHALPTPDGRRHPGRHRA